MKLDPEASRLELWTYKEGLLAGIAHDLCFRAEGWTLTVEAGDDGALRVRAVIPIASLVLRGQVKHGHVTPMKPKDAADIRKNLTSARVLDAAAHPDLVFEGRGAPASGRLELVGQLTLRGASRPLTLRSAWTPTDAGAQAVGEVVFQPSGWGVAPFTALMGALRVRDEVRLSWDLRLKS